LAPIVASGVSLFGEYGLSASGRRDCARSQQASTVLNAVCCINWTTRRRPWLEFAPHMATASVIGSARLTCQSSRGVDVGHNRGYVSFAAVEAHAAMFRTQRSTKVGDLATCVYPPRGEH